MVIFFIKLPYKIKNINIVKILGLNWINSVIVFTKYILSGTIGGNSLPNFIDIVFAKHILGANIFLSKVDVRRW